MEKKQSDGFWCSSGLRHKSKGNDERRIERRHLPVSAFPIVVDRRRLGRMSGRRRPGITQCPSSVTSRVCDTSIGSRTSWTSCGPSCASWRRAWRVRIPRVRHRWSWPSIRGICRLQSSCGRPRPGWVEAAVSSRALIGNGSRLMRRILDSPARASLAFARSCAVLQWSSDRIAGPACSRRE